MESDFSKVVFIWLSYYDLCHKFLERVGGGSEVRRKEKLARTLSGKIELRNLIAIKISLVANNSCLVTTERKVQKCVESLLTSQSANIYMSDFFVKQGKH